MDPFRTSERTTPARLDESGAAEIAVKALAFLAADEERIGAFLAQSGADASQIRALAGDPGFLAGVLDFLMAEDAPLLAFCEETGIAPETVRAARHILSPSQETY